MIEMYPQIRLIRNQDEFNAVVQATQEDAHTSVFPTHMVLRNGEVIGSLGINSLPMVTFWMHSRKAKVRDSLAAFNFVENTLAETGRLCLPVPEGSPFLKRAEDGGLIDFGKAHLYVKVF